MSRDPEHIGWLDLETAGTDEHKDPILEIGLLVTDRNLKEVFAYEAVVRPDVLDLMAMNPVVIEMHTRNGLLAELLTERAHSSSIVVAEILERLHVAGVERMLLGGSGVSHFDRRFLAAQMPELCKLFTYYAYDVGVIRRFLRSCGVLPEQDEDVKPHRALADARLHATEWAEYSRLVTRRGIELEAHA